MINSVLFSNQKEDTPYTISTKFPTAVLFKTTGALTKQLAKMDRFRFKKVQTILQKRASVQLKMDVKFKITSNMMNDKIGLDFASIFIALATFPEIESVKFAKVWNSKTTMAENAKIVNGWMVLDLDAKDAMMLKYVQGLGFLEK